jgi:hypothetical protein
MNLSLQVFCTQIKHYKYLQRTIYKIKTKVYKNARLGLGGELIKSSQS